GREKADAHPDRGVDRGVVAHVRDRPLGLVGRTDLVGRRVVVRADRATGRPEEAFRAAERAQRRVAVVPDGLALVVALVVGEQVRAADAGDQWVGRGVARGRGGPEVARAAVAGRREQRDAVGCGLREYGVRLYELVAVTNVVRLVGAERHRQHVAEVVVDHVL